jgi:hypothetical protein
MAQSDYKQDMTIKKNNIEKKNKRRKNKPQMKDNSPPVPLQDRKSLKAAITAWGDSLLPEVDYNVSGWNVLFHSRSPQDFFEGYNLKLTRIFNRFDVHINFVLIGACDGISDKTIKTKFLKFPNWRAVYVEPMENNFNDLKTFLEDRGGMNRSHLIKAACTSKCANPTLVVERPLYEEKNASLPHWMRRQIGSILPAHRDHARPEWITEEVRCVTPTDIMTEWSIALAAQHSETFK